MSVCHVVRTVLIRFELQLPLMLVLLVSVVTFIASELSFRLYETSFLKLRTLIR